MRLCGENVQEKEILELILSRYVCFVGGRYSRGKSLILTFLTLMDMILNNRMKVYSNMPLNFEQSGFNTLVQPYVSTSFFDNMPTGAIINWDEMPNDINARNFNSVKNKYVSVLSVDIAKKDDRLRGTFQFGDTVEKNLGDLCECIIIPEYVNNYSENTKEDNIQRVKEKDFLQHWIIIDKRNNDTHYELTFNLYPCIFFYNTKYKPIPLHVNHEDYIEKLKPQALSMFLSKNQNKINERFEHWNDGMKEIGKVMIR